MSTLRARYGRLGSLAGLMFFGALVLGLFVSVWLCEVATITLMHPPGGYFADGLRYADPKGRWLTNGEAVSGALRLVTPPLYLLLMSGWLVASLIVITGVAQLFSRRSAAD